MAISHSNHLFVPVIFVFFLLSPLVQAQDSNDYTDSRQLEKKPAVSRQRNNIQRLPNYNWKPPKHYGLRKESTEKKAGAEFTKPEDPEQKVADPWIKKMQEISRRKGEKWIPHKRNENGKLALDNVEESTKVNKLTNDESITIPTFSENAEYDEKITAEDSEMMNLHKEGKSSQVNVEQVDPTIQMILGQSPTDQDSASIKDSSLLESADANSDEPYNKKLKDRRNMGIQNPPVEFLSKATHQRYKDYEISDIKEDPIGKQNATAADYKRSELEEDSSLSSKVNSQSKESISQESKAHHNTRRNFKKNLNNGENLNHKNNSKESLAKEHSRQSNLSRNGNEKSNKASKRHDEKIVTRKPLTRKRSKEEWDDSGEKGTTGRPLNHGGSFHPPGRWGMSISSPPTEFLKERSLRRKNKEHIEGEKDEKHDFTPGRWGMSVASPPKEFLEDISMHRAHETGHSTVKTGPRPSQVEEFSSDHRSLAQQSRRNSQADLTQRSIIDERNKELAKTLYEKILNDLHPAQHPKLDAYWNHYQTNVNINRLLPKNIKFLMKALQPYVEENDVDIPMFCRIQIPYAPFRI